MDRAPTGLLTIVDSLKVCMFSSKAVVGIDSIITSSLFGKQHKRSERRTHCVQTLSKECVVDEETRETIYSTFENGKKHLDFNNPSAYLKTTVGMASFLYRNCSLLKRHGAESKDVIEWCIAAYSMAINPASSVKLSCVRMGPSDTLGFAVHAVTAIKKGQLIRELIGLMASDGKAVHSGLSCIKPSVHHNQSTGVKRVLFGPLRFVNHICATPNIQFVAVYETSGHYAGAMRDIAPGEELLVDYGKGYFNDDPEGCPCATCKPPQPKRRNESEDQAAAEARKKQCRRDKRKRVAKRKKAMWEGKGGQTGESASAGAKNSQRSEDFDRE